MINHSIESLLFHIETKSSLRIDGCEQKAQFLTNCEMRNCESESKSLSDYLSIPILGPIRDKLLKTAEESESDSRF